MDRLDRIDDALQRLTERHETLAESLEILSHGIEADAQNIRVLAGIARDALDSIQRLERVATAHQERLDNHGTRIQGLEDKA